MNGKRQSLTHANAAIFVPHAGCPHRCVFCDQRSISGEQGIPGDDEVAATLSAAARTLGERVRFSEIAFFGGSFTAIPRGEMLRLLRAAGPFLGKGGFAGIRISTRPDALDNDVLGELVRHGVTAVELGAQSMDNTVLEAANRGHTAADVERAAGLVRRHGLALGLQMMTGLPGDTDRAALYTAQSLVALRPDTVRIYPTLVLKHTPLAALWREGRYIPQPLEAAVILCADLLEQFHRQGIRVIRMGLHDTPTLRGDLLAGPYHPAFRELCESRILLRAAIAALRDIPPGPVVLAVARGSISRMVGQKRSGLNELARMGWQATVTERADIGYLAVRAERG